MGVEEVVVALYGDASKVVFGVVVAVAAHRDTGFPLHDAVGFVMSVVEVEVEVGKLPVLGYGVVLCGMSAFQNKSLNAVLL